MTQPFYEIPLPKKVIYMVAVIPDESGDTCECAAIDCKTNADAAEYTDALGNVDIDAWQCDCCGQWFCVLHIGVELCKNCTALPPGLRKEIIAFREGLNK